jgi:hypothetical protein
MLTMRPIRLSWALVRHAVPQPRAETGAEAASADMGRLRRETIHRAARNG